MTRTRVRWGRAAVLTASITLVLGLGGRALGGSPEPGEERTRPQVLVEPDMTLWGIAHARVGPEGDPRPYIQEIRELNGLATSELQVGQLLTLP
ncbi:MAG: LysM peptidoglycan-binding domain-containing protein [Actinomycetota bacterium]